MGKYDKIVAYMLSESTSIASKPIILNTSDCDTAIIETSLQDMLEFNRNRRQYPEDVLIPGLEGDNIVELMSKKSWLGEAGHPMNPTLQRQMTVVHSNVSHRINKWWKQGSEIKGIVETMNFGEGIRMRNYIRQELETAFSLRAVGPVKKTPNGNIVQKPLKVITYDWVFIPSHRNAYQEKIITDGRVPHPTNLTESDKRMLAESYCLPVLKESAIQYVKDESKNFKLISECLEFGGVAILSENNRQIILEQTDGRNKDKLVIGIEDYIANDINSYFNKIK